MHPSGITDFNHLLLVFSELY